MLLKRLLVVAVGAALQASYAHAAPDPTLSATDSKSLDKITVTATRTPQAVGSVSATVSVIDADEIERYGATDIKDLVRYEPGVSVRNQAGRFGLSGFNIRGLDGNRVLIEVDGVRVSDSFSIGDFSNASRNSVDLESLKQVEILRGPGSSLYGSSALGGVVSFVTKDPRDYLGPDDTGYFSAHTGYSSEDENTVLGFTAVVGQGDWSSMAVFNHRQGHEMMSDGDHESQNSTRTASNPQDTSSDSLLAKWVYATAPGRDLRITLDGLRSNVETDVISARRDVPSGPSVVRTTSLTGDDSVERHRITIDYGLKDLTDWIDDGRIALYTQRSDTEQFTVEGRTTITASGVQTPAERRRRFDFAQTVDGLDAQFRTDFDTGPASHQLIYGGEFVRTHTSQLREGSTRNLISGVVSSTIGPDVFPVRDFPLSTTEEVALFMQDEVKLLDGHLSLIPGLRYDSFELTPKADAIFIADNPGITPVGVDESKVSPKLGASYRFDDNWSLHANYARGYRAPPYSDVNIGFTNLAFGYTAIPNPDLKSETSDGFELGVRVRGDLGFVALTGFRNRYEDFIESFASLGVDPVSGLLIFQSRNLSEVVIRGAELRAALELGEWSDHLRGLTLSGAASYAHGEDRSADAPLNSVDPARVVAGLRYTSENGDWDGELIGTAVERKDRVDDSAGGLFRSPGYGLLDLVGRYRINDTVRINAGIYNLTDRHYWEWADVRGRLASDSVIDRFSRPGINANVSLIVEF